jgi:murein DD-endopeptidase MepM/ murein hydrolase activator NlpD
MPAAWSWRAPAGTGAEAEGFIVVRFERFDVEPPVALLGLTMRTSIELPSHARPTLIIERDGVELLYDPRVAYTRRLARGREEWLWRGMFAVPGTLSADPATEFSLRLPDELLLALPAPLHAGDLRSGAHMAGAAMPSPRRRLAPYVLRRGTLLLVVTCQLCLLPVLGSPLALAEGSSRAVTVTETSEAPVASQALPVAGALPAAPSQTASSGQSADLPSESKPAPGSGESEQISVEIQSPGRAHKAPAGEADTGPEQDVAVSIVQDPHSSSGVPPHRSDAAEKRDGSGGRNGNTAQRSSGGSEAPAATPQPDTGATGASGVGEAFWEAGGPFGLPPGFTGFGENGPPGFLIPIYEAAARRYGVPWRVLAAINAVETDYGRNLSVSSAGAVGWMQFMPATWQQWGVDADHSGSADPYSPMDAIFSAARYLRANGAAQDLPAAIFAYNHAGWYVTEVLLHARALEGDLVASDSERGYALPLDAQYMRQLGRTDDGVDIETAPDGALVYSMTPGVVTAVASDPAGFGPNYPVIEATAGPLAGQHVYYGHVALALVKAGQQVSAGQPIAVMGHTGDAAGLGRGHIEIGFSDPAGDPLDHHGTEAATPAGALMRGFLVTLTEAVGHSRARAAAARHLRAAAAARRARAHRAHASRGAGASVASPPAGDQVLGRRLR